MKILALLLATTLAASAQKMQTPSGEAPGPWLLGTIGVGKAADGTMKTTALKGLAIKVGEKGEAAVCYDLDLCRMAGAWTGGKFTTPMNLMSRGEYPTALGEVAFTTGEVAGFISGEGKEPWKDPRPEPFGPLPKGQARFKGFHVCGDQQVLVWDIAGTEVLEHPGFIRFGELDRFIRSFHVAPGKERILIPLCPAVPGSRSYDDMAAVSGNTGPIVEGTTLGVFSTLKKSIRKVGGMWCLDLPPRSKPWFGSTELLISASASVQVRLSSTL